MKALVAGVTLTAITATALARVGEAEKELVMRFGTPIARSEHIVVAQGKIWKLGPTLVFRQDDWSITCDLVDGRVVRESYGKSGEWTEAHIQTVLNANAQGATWTEINKGSNRSQRTWRRTDGATASWIIVRGMRIVVPAYERAKVLAESKAKAEANKPAKI
jgi:hypothetical protein